MRLSLKQLKAEDPAKHQRLQRQIVDWFQAFGMRFAFFFQAIGFVLILVSLHFGIPANRIIYVLIVGTGVLSVFSYKKDTPFFAAASLLLAVLSVVFSAMAISLAPLLRVPENMLIVAGFMAALLLSVVMAQRINAAVEKQNTE